MSQKRFELVSVGNANGGAKDGADVGADGAVHSRNRKRIAEASSARDLSI